jgi:membrane associated rhomboid family serine protease
VHVKPAPTGRDWLFRLPLGAPWASYALIANCVLVTLPLFIDPARFYPVIGVGYCEQDSTIHWYHALLTQFVHGVGCGFPPTWLHLTINTALFLFHGALVERVLGSARFALLTATNLAVAIVSSHLLVGGRSHGASVMSWSYGLFCALALHALWRAQRWHMFRDGVTCLMALWLVCSALGLIVPWHVLSVVVSLPFFIAWRGLFMQRLSAVSRQRTPADRWGIAFFTSVLVFDVVIVALIIARVLA